MVYQIPHQVRASLGPSNHVWSGCRYPAAKQLLSQGAGFEPQHQGPLVLMLCGPRVFAGLLLTAHPSGLSSQRQNIHSLPLCLGDTACQTPQKEADPEQVSKDKAGFMFFFTFQPCVLPWEAGNKSL